MIDQSESINTKNITDNGILPGSTKAATCAVCFLTPNIITIRQRTRKEWVNRPFPNNIILISQPNPLLWVLEKPQHRIFDWDDSFENPQHRIWMSNKDLRTWKVPLIVPLDYLELGIRSISDCKTRRLNQKV